MHHNLTQLERLRTKAKLQKIAKNRIRDLSDKNKNRNRECNSFEETPKIAVKISQPGQDISNFMFGKGPTHHIECELEVERCNTFVISKHQRKLSYPDNETPTFSNQNIEMRDKVP